MRHFIFFFLALSGVSSLHAQTEPAYIHPLPGGQSWKIGNTLVERELHYSPRFGLYTDSWRHKLTGKEFLQHLRTELPWGPETRWGAEFSFEADGVHLAGATRGPAADFDFVGIKRSDIAPQGKLLEITLKARKKPLQVSAFYAVYASHPVIRKWVAIANQSQQTIEISHLAFESLNLEAAPPGEQVVSAYDGVHPRENFFTGRVEDAAILAKDPRNGEGFIVMNEAPAWMKRTEITNWGDGLRVMYDTDLFPFERSIKPGETFTSAKSGVAFFADGRGFADPHWVMPSYTSQVLMRKGASFQPPWVYNTDEPFNFGVPYPIVSALVSVAGRMGVDIFTLDAGWEKLWGENDISPKNFPQGLDPVRAEVERQGMRLGLWQALAIVRPESQVYQQHPDWQCKDAHGKPKTSWFGEPWGGDLPVMCLASPYREVAAQRLGDLISRYHLGYVKLDLTTVFNAYGEAPGCYAEGHFHHGWAESLEGIYEGIQYVTERVSHEHPDVVLDCSFELWGQKHLVDYGVIEAGDVDWMSNVDDSKPHSAGPRQARTLLYHRSLGIPADAMLVGNLRATSAPIEERFATEIGSGPLLLGDLRLLTPEEQDWYGQRIRWFKDFHRAVALNEGFFPLGGWLQPAASTLDGFLRVSRQGEGLLVVFRNEATEDKLEVKVSAFPDGSFHLRSVITGKPVGAVSGERIRQGMQIRVPLGHKVEVLEIRK